MHFAAQMHRTGFTNGFRLKQVPYTINPRCCWLGAYADSHGVGQNRTIFPRAQAAKGPAGQTLGSQPGLCGRHSMGAADRRTIAWLQNLRRVQVRCDRIFTVYQGFVPFACLLVVLRHL